MWLMITEINAFLFSGPFQPTTEMKLKFYACYKQATAGPCTAPKPAFYDIINRKKWYAINKFTQPRSTYSNDSLCLLSFFISGKHGAHSETCHKKKLDKYI